ncbi:MAG: OsmC family protein [Acidobacteria bacterium]|nr:OsmC family protein [Acidobacteriota bacterium]MCB9398056.1 OsmC family protein [Acidobacteriota bacterium]
MVMMKVEYQGDLRCQISHGPSGNTLITDAPVDNRGKGSSFSPTDLCASSLGACLLTIMGMSAMDHGWDMLGARIELEKVMSSEAPRRIAQVRMHIHMPHTLDEKARTILERVARTCPVARSLHPDLVQELVFHWPGVN